MNFMMWMPVLSVTSLCGSSYLYAGTDTGHVPSVSDLLSNLDEKLPALQAIIDLRNSGQEATAARELAVYLAGKAAGRYYFNWQNFAKRFDRYRRDYPQMLEKHRSLARYQMDTYEAETFWQLPFTDKKGRPVTAYELRHLSRQQKSADMTLMYYYQNRDKKYLDYFLRQVADLNRAYTNGQFDDAGNAVFESYRAGKRIHNWLFNHHAYLASRDYKADDQLLLLRTFIYHGNELYQRTKKNRFGNHHTKGLTALFEIAALFPEFIVTKKWREQALQGLAWHISKEINSDGFQFERSIHYHIGDIENYFRVYQLAKRNGIELPEVFIRQFRKMFDALVLLARPDRRLPVLQDDTDSPYEESNEMAAALTVGTLLFRDNGYRYFAGNDIPPSVYWLISDGQLDLLDQLKPKRPRIGSAVLPATGYYVMRSGWENDDWHLVISVGLSTRKPDHQHGDMLGVQLWANGRNLLPNYQVRYKHSDYRFFKGSWVKNVALVDSVQQSRGWQANRGRSGFGKWTILPRPTVHNWSSDGQLDYFAASHDGFDSLGVAYTREVLFFKKEFWLVRDHFRSATAHSFQQVWQGLYESDEKGLTRRYADGSGLSIIQLNSDRFDIRKAKFRDKGNALFEISGRDNYTFNTLLVPFTARQNRARGQDKFASGSWQIYEHQADKAIEINGLQFWADLLLGAGQTMVACSAKKIVLADQKIEFSEAGTFVIRPGAGSLAIKLLGAKEVTAQISGEQAGSPNERLRIRPGEEILIKTRKKLNQ